MYYFVLIIYLFSTVKSEHFKVEISGSGCICHLCRACLLL